MNARDFFNKLSALSKMPSDSSRLTWLTSAKEDAERLLTEEEDDHIILYASFRNLWVVGVFAPAENLAHPNKDDLYNARIQSDDAWCIQRAWGGGQDHRIYLEPPLDFAEGHPLRGAEPIVFRRSFEGMSGYRSPIEVAQKFIHSLGLHFIDARNAYCRLDDEGNIQEVLHVFSIDGTGNFDSQAAVLVDPKALAEYMAVGGLGLYRKFDITRTDPKSFTGWATGSQNFQAPDFFYNFAQDPKASYVHGGQILRPTVTVQELVDDWIASENPESRQYETFKIHDWKNKRLVEWSSAPSELGNYFVQSDKPFEISPAYFSPEVLTKYKADPEKYDLHDRSIACRNSWYLKTYDINKAGQVHTYIGYLQGLPFKEQQHWKLHNEWPKGGLSKRAFETDFEGRWASEIDPLQALRHAVERLDEKDFGWWKLRGTDVRSRVHYPVTTSSKEWADELLALDQMLVEGYVAKEIRKIATSVGVEIQKEWQSLKLIQETLRTLGYEDAEEIVSSLRKLHHLRSKVSGHRTQERVELEAEAFREYGSLGAQFRALCSDCNEAFPTIVDALTEKRRAS